MSHDSSNANVAEPSMVATTLSERRAKMADAGIFFKKFIAKGRTISSAVPSSRAMVNVMLNCVDFSRPATIIELGAGTGPVTEQLVENLRPHHRFVAVENDSDFCEILRRRFPEVTLLQMDATKVGEPLAKLGITKVDYVLSGLPTPNLPPKSLVRLWRWLGEVLAPNGKFIQITVVPMFYRQFYDRLFDSVRYEMVWPNVPPGGVYCCSHPKAHLYRTR